MNEPRNYILRNLCRGYISTMFAMSLGQCVHEYDKMRVKYHSSIEKYFGIRYDDERQKKLNIILHALQREIKFPIPEHAGYGEATITLVEVEMKFACLSDLYGDLLYDKLKSKFVAEKFKSVSERFGTKRVKK